MIPQKEPFKFFCGQFEFKIFKKHNQNYLKITKKCFPEWLFIYQKQIVESCLKLISEAVITILSLFSDMKWKICPH